MTRKNLTVVQRQPPQEAQDTPERFHRLTSLIRVNGKPLESVLFRMLAEKEARDE